MDELKEKVAIALSQRVKSGEIIGLGSGSTAELTLVEIGKRIKNEKLSVLGVATSYRTASIARENGIQVVDIRAIDTVDWAFDGADEVDEHLRLIKGGGAAMLSEKIMAKRAQGKLVIVVSEDKLVKKLGTRFAVPVEVISEAVLCVERELKKLGAKEIVLRKSRDKYGPVVTEHGNLVIDARFDEIKDELENKIKSIVGVVESGLFFNYSSEVLVAGKDGISQLKLSGGKVERNNICP